MAPLIKIDLKKILTLKKEVKLDLGCGNNKKENYIGIDILDLPNVDIIADLEEGFPFLPDNTVDAIFADNYLEHVKNFEFLIKEIVRVLKVDGKCHVIVPHFSNPYYYSDYTHVRPFGLYTFAYFCDITNQKFKRKVPSFYSNIRIEILNIRLNFKGSYKPFKWIMKLLKKYVNNSIRNQEYYEQHLSSIFPCYNMEIIFKPIK